MLAIVKRRSIELSAPVVAGERAPIPYLTGVVLAFLWGIGQQLPYESLYIAGIGAGDIFFLLYLAVEIGTRWEKASVVVALYEIRQFALLVLLFVLLTVLSGTVNALRTQMLLKDLVETLRPLYYLAMTAFVVAWVKQHGLPPMVVAFLAGILTVAILNYTYGAGTGLVVVGFTTMNNPNVVGNMIGIGVFMASLLVLSGWLAIASGFLAVLLPLTLFTYSKGAWVMSIFGVLAAAIAAGGEGKGFIRAKWPKVVAALALVVIAAGAIYFRQEIGLLIAFKLKTTQLDSSAAEGGTVAQRWSFVIASLRMVMDHPLLGVGLSNYGMEYDRLREYLGAAYHATDNPHSAFLYILACTGLPAFAVFIAIFVYPFTILARVLPLTPLWGAVYTMLALLTFFFSAAVQLELLSQPFFWVFAGLVLGWAVRVRALAGSTLARTALAA